MKRSLNIFAYLVLLLLIGMIIPVSAQKKDTVLQNGFAKFTYPGGQLSSEGLIKNGKPDGYWKSQQSAEDPLSL